ncbi:sugar ABC transporter substrate-binding protein [Leptolyngbya sp. 'hensonii']|nr:sugar ABC transporter substrate-binding protein [Leptolyngbya sp. 'hensonii']
MDQNRSPLPNFPAVSPRGEESYILGPGDRVRIDVFKVPQYSGENQVLVDGTLNLPDIGPVFVRGLTLLGAADAISQRYASLLRYPNVTVILLAPGPVKVGIAGEVNRPGSYTIPIESGTQLPTLTKAIQLAGGITQAADLRRVQVRRPRGNAPDEVIDINLWDFLQTGDLSRDLTIRSGDTIYIPTATQVDLTESKLIAAASFAPDKNQPLNVAVVGEVYRPGPYTVTGTARTGAAGVPGGTGGNDRTPTITRAIQVAGGIKPMADIQQIKIIRLTKTGTEQTIEVNLWKLLKEGDIRQDVILQEGDTIVIPLAKTITPQESTQIAAASFSPDTIRVNVVGEVKRPGLVQVPPNIPLTQGVLAAGGFTNRSEQGSVDLIRLNPDGTVSRRTIKLDFAQGLDETLNPPLRNDDVIIVSPSALTSFSDVLGTVLNPIGSFFSIFNFFRIFSEL